MINKFKIVTGLTPQDEISTVIKDGIDEVYCGYYDSRFNKKWPVAFTTVNRRGEGVNFKNFKDLAAKTRQLFKRGVKSFVTFNGCYTEEQYSWLIRNIKKTETEKSIEGLIVNDIGLLLLLKKLKYKKNITISTLASAFNSSAVDFYKKFGASRIVLDRQLTAAEIIETAVKYPELEFEVFVVSTGGCLFIDGYCSFFHCLEKPEKIIKGQILHIRKYDITTSGAGCCELLNCFSKKQYSSNTQTQRFSLSKTLGFNCNICMLYKLKNIKNISLKIDSRGANGTGVTGIEMLKDLLNAAEKSKNQKQYAAFAKKTLMKFKKIKCNPAICLCGGKL